MRLTRGDHYMKLLEAGGAAGAAANIQYTAPALTAIAIAARHRAELSIA